MQASHVFTPGGSGCHTTLHSRHRASCKQEAKLSLG